MTEQQKFDIEQDAERCAREGIAPKAGCPHPWHTEQAVHWVACWILAGGTLS